MILTFRLTLCHRHRYLCCNLTTKCVLQAHNAGKCDCGRDSTPDLAVGTYSAPPGPLANFKGGKGNGKGWDGNGKGRKAAWAEELSKLWGRDTLA